MRKPRLSSSPRVVGDDANPTLATHVLRKEAVMEDWADSVNIAEIIRDINRG